MYSAKGKLSVVEDVERYGGVALWLLFRCVPCLVLLGLLALSSVAPTARASEGEPGELGAGQLMLHSADGRYVQAVLQGSKVHFDIAGMIATVTLEQRFTNTTGDWVEGVYAFPLPDSAAVRRLEMLVGERRILGEIREKAEAREIYTQAKASGKKAALVEQQRGNLFTNRVANIAPGEAMSVTLEYVQQVEFKAGRFSLRLPTTITPRYMPGVPLVSQEQESEQSLSLTPAHGWAVPTDQVPDAPDISPLQHPRAGSDAAPINPIEITARLDIGMPLASVDAAYHEIAMSRRAGVYEIKLARGVTEMDRDFLLQWQPVSGSSPTAALFTEKVEGVHYGLLMLLPPSVERASTPMPREIVFVVDTSGSMGGVSIRQARDSLDEALRQLRPQDRFNIIAFNSSHRALYRQAVPASPHHIQQATEFVRHLSASGGTEMMPALLAALSEQSELDPLREQAALRQVIFITDGAVGNEAALFEQISKQLGRNRLFTVGIGSAPNSWFMRKAARFGRGTYTYIGDVGEVAGKMSALFAQLSRPAAVDIQVEWPAAVDAWPRRIPDLYLGEPLLLATRFGETMPAGEVVVRGMLAGTDWRTGLAIPGDTDPAHRVDHPGVGSLWAKYKIQSLLDEKARGRAEPEVRSEVLPVALEHQLISPYTSFVAVEEQISRPGSATLESKPVPNSRPKGQSAQPFAYPNTATTARAQIWLGAFALMMTLLVRVARQEEVQHAQ